MRGKTRALTRFNKFKDEIISIFPNASREENTPFSHLVFFLENCSNMQLCFQMTCDKDENLNFDQYGPAPSLYQVFRIANKPLLLRDLENFSRATWEDIYQRLYLYTALSVLVGVNLIDYKVIPNGENIEDSLQFFIKDDE